MYSSALTARVVFLVVWCECVQLVRREGVRVREEWRGADRLPPQLSLHTAHLQDVCVQVRLRVLPLQANENLTIDFRDSETDSDTLVLLVWKQDGVRWCVRSSSDDLCEPHTARIQTREHERPIVNMTSHQAFWNLRYNCFPARTGSTVTVSVHRDEDLLISGSHVVQLTEPVDKDPVPEAGVSVDERQKRFTVRMETDQTVKIGLCYKQSSHECKVLKDVKKINKTTANQTVDLSFPFLIPCVCVQLWFTVTDARRNTLCPLKERILPHGGDILSSSSARVLGSVLLWEPVCHDDQSDPSVSLCWRIHTQNYCVPAPNATLYGTKREYNVSAVDQHPQMCVKFSLNGSHRVFCPFESERRSKWSVTVVPGSLHLHVHLTSDIAASFAAQLCDRDEDTCASRGHVFSRQLDGGATEAELSLPFPFLSSGLCVQVWRRDLHGRRIICPDFTHRRWGFVVGAALTLLAAVIVLVRFARWLLKKIPSVWRSERRPVLLVCSSNDAPHVAAVCSLASGLQGELCMDVRLAQWMQCHAPLSLAQLGPVPWLYAQCQAVQKAGGLVLIAWSPDARRAYLRWRKSELCKTGLYGAVEEDEEEQMCCDEERTEKPTESSSSITAPVFGAALSSLWMGIRGDGHGRGFGLVCFPSLDNNVSRIPKRLRCVRKYCLPKDLSSLIHDLTGSRDGAGKTRGRCWPRLLSKALSFFASRQLAPRLEAKLPVPTDSPKLPSMLSKKSTTKTWRQKKRRSKVVSSFLSRKGCLKKKTPES